MEEDGTMASHSKKMISTLRRERRKIERNLGGIREMDRMPGARWFPDASLNFAENLLRFRDDRDALVFVAETGLNSRLSYRELYRQVADMDGGFWSDHCALFQRAFEQDRDGVLALLEKGDYRKAAKTDEQYPIHIANALTLVGEIDEALRWLPHAIEYGFLNYRFLSQHNRFLVPLRGDARFEQLMEIARQRHDAFRV